MNTKQRDEAIRKSDEHWRVLAERHGLSRSSIYRIRREGDEPFEAAERPAGINNRKLLFSQTASSGLTRYGGSVEEEFQRELQGDGGAKLYTEMATYPVIAAVLLAFRMSIRFVNWFVEPASDKPADKEAAEHVEQCRNDMSQSWDEIVSQALTMLQYGFSAAELVYKLRLGSKPRKYVSDPARSRYDDGRIGWRRWQFMSPKSLTPGNQWDFDERGRVQGVRQTPPPDYVERYVPLEKALLFRTVVDWDNPEGLALLRAMYSPWYYATNLGEVEAIGAERLGTGLPVVYLGSDTSSTGSDSDYELAIDMVRNVRTDEQMGLVIPKAKMGAGAPEGAGMLFELLSPPSRGVVDFNQVITRYEQRMAMSALTQFIFLGMAQVGTQALAGETIDFYQTAVSAWADSVAGIVNRFAVPRLMALNTFRVDELPRLAHTEFSVPDLKGISDYINALVGAQVLLPYPELEQHLIQLAGLPEKPAELRKPEPSEPEPEEGEVVHDEPEGEEASDEIVLYDPWYGSTDAARITFDDKLGSEQASEWFGGPGSGHHGHKGIPGQRGGSSPGGAGIVRIDSSYNPPKLNDSIVGELEAMGQWEAHSAAGELGLGADLRAYDRVNRRWTQGADSSAKPEIKSFLKSGRGIRELTLYEDWSNSKSDSTFKEWLDTPQTFYRGGGRSDHFLSFAKSERVARDASKAANLVTVLLKPSQLLGSGMTGAGEVYLDSEAVASIDFAEVESEPFAQRLRPGGPTWERATNRYQAELESAWTSWADSAAARLAAAESDEDFDRTLDEEVAAIVALLVALGRTHLQEAATLGLGGAPPTPELMRELADKMAANEQYLRESLGPAVTARVRAAAREEPLIKDDQMSMAALFGVFRARVSSYAGAFWALIMRGLIDRLRGDPDLSTVPVRWVLHPTAKHCPDCLEYTGEYENIDTLLAKTGGAVPTENVQCDGNCRCWLEYYIKGRWVRRT